MKALSALFGVFLGMAMAAPVLAQERLALVIGNGRYERLQRLEACPRDAENMVETFQKIGIKIFAGKAFLNLTSDQMDAAVNDFVAALKPNSEAFLYYSGHGAQFNGINYLLPVNFDAKYQSQAQRQAISLENILALLEKTDTRLRVVILDACRDPGDLLPGEPKLKGTYGKGLGEQKVDVSETLVCFATKHGTASLADDTASFYTRILAEEIIKPVEITSVMRSVARRVNATTEKRQLPFTYGSLLQEHFLAGRGDAPVAPLASNRPAMPPGARPLRAGIIGLDTTHVIAFAQSLNKGPKNPEDAAKVAGVKVFAAYPQGSKDIESSTQRIPEYTEKVKAMGVEIVASIEELVKRVDVVFLESNDGRVHWAQFQPVLAARKPVFIDKPIAGSLVDTIRILDAAKKANVPLFCSSALRFGKDTQAVRNGLIGKVKSAETFSPVILESTHPDLYWYGVHGCESLFTVMGTGCKSVKRGVGADGKVEVTGKWADGRVGIFREQNGYGGRAIGEKGEAPIGSYEGYDVLLFEIVKMFRTGVPPVSAEETLELYAFMEAADESKRRNGAEVTLQEVIDKARKELAGK